MTRDEVLDFDRLTDRQREVLSLIAVNQDGGHHSRVLKYLLAKKLIEEVVQEEKDRMGTFRIRRYVVPLPIHIAWCEYCSQKED